MSHSNNVFRIKVIHDALGELANEVVFVGGATVSLYADRPAADVRPTDDVDILVELLNYSGYAGIEEKLRKKGFVNDIQSKVICRYLFQGIIVDVMPTGQNVLGFSNRWYQMGYDSAMEYRLGEGYRIRIFQPALFIASKLEAFKNRGKSDGRFSSDFEDIVFILNYRRTIWNELRETAGDVRSYVQNEFSELLKRPYIGEWISAHLEHTEQRKVNLILNELRAFVESQEPPETGISKHTFS